MSLQAATRSRHGAGAYGISERYRICMQVIAKKAEWHRNLSPAFSSESLVTDGQRAGQGGIPAASPSAPRSERQEVPTLPDPRGIHPDSVSIRRDPLATARLGQATLTTG